MKVETSEPDVNDHVESNLSTRGPSAGAVLASDAADLAELTAHVRDAERAIARAVQRAARVAKSGVCELVEGMPLELWLANACRLIGTDRHTLITASEGASRRLTRDQRTWLDERIDQTMNRWDGLDALGPDGLLDAVDRAMGLSAFLCKWRGLWSLLSGFETSGEEHFELVEGGFPALG